ncbi:methylenetetrahydrofolate reductase [bacterium]|nr:methylenetetrahydrofolate reductase [bacterium]MBU4361508.1 methylenetetrahydrofolate reductase [bacterium]MBU4601949.1 methylenetetrahydrofolate reductase [bacterium]
MNLREKLAANKFVVTVELDPPKTLNLERILTEVNSTNFRKLVDAVNVTDCPLAKLRMSPIALSHIIQEKIGLEAIFHITCRDRNLLGLQAELLGASALGVKNILALTGDPPEGGDYIMATGVYDVDSIGLVKMVNKLNNGYEYGGNEFKDKTDFFIGIAVNPTAQDLTKEIKRFEKKVSAGANFIQTQPIYDIGLLERFLKLTAHINIPKIIGIMPLKSYKMVEYLNKNLPGIFVPPGVKERMREKDVEEGVKISRELISEIHKFKEAAGIHIFPLRDMDLVCRLLN